MTNWLIAIAILVVIVILFLLEREIFRYEGIHLGARLQSWLYDRWAKKYDRDKGASQAADAENLARPLLARLSNAPEPFILDVATGTGRLPFALASQPGFEGALVAVDISRGMLRLAAQKLAPHRAQVSLLQYKKLPLPFPDETFDAVACVEALEVMRDKKAAAAELARLLRPGGILLTSRGVEGSGHGRAVIGRETLTGLLHSAGFEAVEITPWWKVFERVFARKPGVSTPAGKKTLAAVLQCPHCRSAGQFSRAGSALRCSQCGKEIEADEKGIVIL
jgi:SAM-dependent methyltransferase